MKTTTIQETIPNKKTTLDGMTTYEICRWAALKEAVDLLGEKCDERNIELSSNVLQPLEILQYVESVTDVLYNQVTLNEKA